jgi:hypothetical protein
LAICRLDELRGSSSHALQFQRDDHDTIIFQIAPGGKTKYFAKLQHDPVLIRHFTENLPSGVAITAKSAGLGRLAMSG